MSILVFGHLLPFLYNKCCRLTLSILCLRLGINTFTTLFTSSTLVHFSGKWYLETKIWALKKLITTGVSLLLGPLNGHTHTHTHVIKKIMIL